MPTTKLITGDKFIAGLLREGIVTNRTKAITIRAEVGEPITLTITTFGDDRLLQLLENNDVIICHDPAQAVAR